MCLTVVLVACSSDDDASSQAAKEFSQNTEWVGVLDRSGYQLAPPAYLHFKEDDNLVVYAGIARSVRRRLSKDNN